MIVFAASDHPLRGDRHMRAEQGLAVLKRFPDTPFHPQAVRAYFEAVYWKLTPERLDERGVLNACDGAARDLDLPLASIAEWMRLIDDVMRPVIVVDDAVGHPDGTAPRLVGELDRPGSGHRLGALSRATLVGQSDKREASGARQSRSTSLTNSASMRPLEE